MSTCLAVLLSLTTVPAPPSPAEWMFRGELARPAAYRAREAYRIVDEYGLDTEATATVRTDLDRFMLSAGKPPRKTLTLRKGEVDGVESHRIEVLPDGDVVLTAGDDDGIRRAACWFEDRVTAGDLSSVTRKPWLRNRISRCFFGPIKRPPLNRDELMDDIDYYPEEYLNRLAHEGINGLWLTVELRDLVGTSFNERHPDALRRLAKLRRTVAKCRRYGIRTWIFCIEPRQLDADDPLRKTLPAEAIGTDARGRRNVLCPSSGAACRYVEEAFADLFAQVPGLAGCINISHGERRTTCLSSVRPVTGIRSECPACSRCEPWKLHWRTASAMVKGMRKGNPRAELISWIYHPEVESARAAWVPEVARHLPDGVTMLYNFESGAVGNQLGRLRPGGDYWLSYAGPSPAFWKVADAACGANGRIGAKIQVGCSHECATVPFVPVPGLLYRKYRAMRSARCLTVMQCWYFGNCPGVMNKAAGELAFSDFSEGEDAFLLRLAKPEWGDSAPLVARLWKCLSDAYANYPLSNDMQYYGPFHAGIAWPLLPDVGMRPLARTWKPLDAPSGDAIGECLENHTIEEAAILAERMSRGLEMRVADGRPVLTVLEERFASDKDRRRDLGVIRALGILFASGSDILEFYRLREKAVSASRFEGDSPRALAAVREMGSIIVRECRLTSEMRALCADDSRLGFHSEAEVHQFYPAKLDWRLRGLETAKARLEEIAAELSAGRPYPSSECERTSPSVRAGERIRTDRGFEFTVRFCPNEDLELDGFVPKTRDTLIVHALNACATAWPYELALRMDGWSVPTRNVIAPSAPVREYRTERKGAGWTFHVVLDARGWGGSRVRRPSWIHFAANESDALWPEAGESVDPANWRLNIGWWRPFDYGRIVEE